MANGRRGWVAEYDNEEKELLSVFIKL